MARHVYNVSWAHARKPSTQLTRRRKLPGALAAGVRLAAAIPGVYGMAAEAWRNGARSLQCVMNHGQYRGK